jgi:type IV pilus assembly protein PilA
MKRNTKSRGFTLIELMIVVAIVGILAVLAIYGVRKYLANAKTAEARNSLGQIGKDQSLEWEKESMSAATMTEGASAGLSHSLCTAPTKTVPAAIAAVTGQKYQSAAADWSVDQATPGMGFACLNFTMQDPQYYMYNFTTTTPTAAGGTFTATATGDLDGNGVTSVFTMSGIVQPLGGEPDRVSAVVAYSASGNAPGLCGRQSRPRIRLTAA